MGLYGILKIKSGRKIMKLLVFFLIFGLVLFLVNKVIERSLGIERGKISETSGRNIDRWGRGIIVVIFLSILWFVIDKDIDVMKWYLIIYFVVSFGFQSILEWKFLRVTKQYVTTLVFLLLSVIIFYNIEYLFQLLNVM